MHWVVKLNGSYRCEKLEGYRTPQWWTRESATPYPTRELADEAREWERVRGEYPYIKPKHGRCDCDACSVPRVVRVRTKDDLRREREALRGRVATLQAALGEAACCARGYAKLYTEATGGVADVGPSVERWFALAGPVLVTPPPSKPAACPTCYGTGRVASRAIPGGRCRCDDCEGTGAPPSKPVGPPHDCNCGSGTSDDAYCNERCPCACHRAGAGGAGTSATTQEEKRP